MKRLVLTLVAGAFGSLLVLPMAHAADYEDMSNDANAIHQDQRDIRQDKREQREDLEHGNFGAAAREQEDIEQRPCERERDQGRSEQRLAIATTTTTRPAIIIDDDND